MGKKKSTPKVESAPAVSAYQPYTAATVNLGALGSSTSQGSGNTISTSFNPSPEFSALQTSNLQGLKTQGDALNVPLEQQYAALPNNPFYLAQAAQNTSNYNDQSSQLQHSMNQRGLENSTVLGAFAGQQARDANLLDQSARANAINQQNTLGQANFQGQQSLLNSLATIAMQPTQLSNNQLNTAFGAQDATAMFNAQQQNQAAALNAQMQFQAQLAAQQRQQALLGAGIGALGTVASAGLLGGLGAGTAGLGRLGGLFGLGKATPPGPSGPSGLGQFGMKTFGM